MERLFKACEEVLANKGKVRLMADICNKFVTGSLLGIWFVVGLWSVLDYGNWNICNVALLIATFAATVGLWRGAFDALKKYESFSKKEKFHKFMNKVS